VVDFEPELHAGWVDHELADEFPDLALWTVRVQAQS